MIFLIFFRPPAFWERFPTVFYLPIVHKVMKIKGRALQKVNTKVRICSEHWNGAGQRRIVVSRYVEARLPPPVLAKRSLERIDNNPAFTG